MRKKEELTLPIKDLALLKSNPTEYYSTKTHYTIDQMKRKLNKFTDDEREILMEYVPHDEDINKWYEQMKGYHELCELKKSEMEHFRSDLEKRIEQNKGEIAKKYNESDYDNISKFLIEEYGIHAFDDYVYRDRWLDVLYSEKDYKEERFQYERSIIESRMHDDEIAQHLAQRGDYGSARKTVDRIEELGLTPPDWIVAEANKVDIKRVQAVVSGSGEVRNHANSTRGIQEIHTESSDEDGGMFSVVANSREDINRLAEKVGATEVHHEEGDLYTLIVPYSL